MNLFNIEREKYWAPPVSYDRQKIKQLSQTLISSGNYICSEKKDGNWAVYIQQDGEIQIQTRGISKVTGTYTDIKAKVPLVAEYMHKLMGEGNCFVIGELYYPGGCDHDVGSILRCLPKKAVERQKDNPLRFYIFDAWVVDNYSLMDTYMEQRIEKLYAWLKSHGIDSYSSIVEMARYYEAKNANKLLADVLARGGEGVVLQRKDGKPEPGKRPARKSMKLKKELTQDIDVVCMGLNPPTRNYTGKDVENWTYWEDTKYGTKYNENLYHNYITGNSCLEPVTKNYFYGIPGSISCGAYRDGKLVKICDLAGIPDEIKFSMRDDPNEWIGHPLRITGMESTDDFSIRHPKLIGFRDDIPVKDCTWEKIFG